MAVAVAAASGGMDSECLLAPDGGGINNDTGGSTSSDSASRSSSRRPKQPRSRDYEHIASTGGLDSARGQNQHELTKKYTERDARI